MANNFPAIRSSLNLDFVNGVYVDPRVTFSRAGTRTYFGREVVKAEENLLLQSQAFDDAAWTKTAVTISANSTAAPDGTTTADTVTGSAGTTLKVVFPAAANTGLASAVATFSIFAKEGTHRYIQVSINGDATKYVNFDLNGSGATSAFGSGVTSSVTAAANGFIRCIVSLTGHPNTSRFYVSLQDSLAAAREASTASTGDIFLWGAQTELRSAATAYTPTTTQPITRYQRQLKTAAANEWPREFDPVTGECLGRSVWESRTNLLQRSEEFDNAYWVKGTGSASSQGTGSEAVVTANQGIGLAGTLTADRVVLNLNGGTTSSDRSGFHAVFTATIGVTYTSTLILKILDGTTQAQLLGAINFGVLAADATPSSSSVTPLGNNIFRVVRTVTALTTSATFRVQLIGGQSIDSLDCLILGAQLEAGAFATPYIPTVASQVTRLADSAVMTGVNFSSWFNPEQGCLLIDAVSVNAGSSTATITALGSADATNRITILSRTSGATGVYSTAIANSATQAEFTGTHAASNKVAVSYAFNDYKGCLNGGTVSTDTTALVPVMTNLSIGSTVGTVFSGYYKRLTYYPQALTAANLQAVTR